MGGPVLAGGQVRRNWGGFLTNGMGEDVSSDNE